MKSETHLLAYLALAAWASIAIADHIGMLGSSWPALSLVAVFYLASCFGLHRMRRDGVATPGLVPWLSALVLAWCLLLLHGTLIEAIQLQELLRRPSKAGLALLALNGLLAALATAAVLAYPLSALYGRHAGTMSVVVALPTFGLAADTLSSTDTLGMGFSISVLDWVWLYVALRTVPAWASRRMAG